MLNLCTCPSCQKANRQVRGLTKREEELTGIMSDMFDDQLAYAEKIEVWRTKDFNWLTTGFWNKEMQRRTRGVLRIEAELAAKHQSRVLGIQIADFVDRPRVVRALDQEGYRFARAVNETTANRLRDQLKEGEQAGETVAQLTSRVKDVFVGTEREANWRAEMVARTETAQAYTVGTTEHWRETGVVEGVIWVASADACEFCLAMDGRSVRLGTPFFELGDKLYVQGKAMSFDYRPIDGPALHPFCRCAIKAELKPIGSRRSKVTRKEEEE
jgi:hypothetical protein